MGIACISQNPPKVLRGVELFGGQGGQMAVAGSGLWVCVARGLSEEASNWFSGSSHFCLKTLGLPHPQYCGTLTSFPYYLGGGGGMSVVSDSVTP